MDERLYDYLDEKFANMNNRFFELENALDEANSRLKIIEAKEELLALSLDNMELSEMIDESAMKRNEKFVKTLTSSYANNDK
jgi:hypothetical protein